MATLFPPFRVTSSDAFRTRINQPRYCRCNVLLDVSSRYLLHELLPHAARFAVLLNPNDLNADNYVKDLQAAASTIGWQIEFLGASSVREIATAFANLAKKRPDALLVVPQGLAKNI